MKGGKYKCSTVQKKKTNKEETKNKEQFSNNEGSLAKDRSASIASTSGVDVSSLCLQMDSSNTQNQPNYKSSEKTIDESKDIDDAKPFCLDIRM